MSLFTATVATYAFFAPAPPPEQPLQFLPKADRLVPPAPHIYKPASETNTIITGPMVELAPGGKSTNESSPDLNQRHGGASVAARARGRGPVLATVKSIERRSAVSQPEVNRAGTFVPAGITPSIMDAADEEAAKKPEAAQSADNQNARRRLADSMRDLAEGEREGSPGARYAPASAGREDERSEFSPTPMDAPVVPLPRSRPKKIK